MCRSTPCLVTRECSASSASVASPFAFRKRRISSRRPTPRFYRFINGGIDKRLPPAPDHAGPQGGRLRHGGGADRRPPRSAAAEALGPRRRGSTALFLASAALGLVTAVLPLALSRRVEVDRGAPAFGDLRPLAGLASLFALDAIGGGLVANAVIAYWLHRRFGAGAEGLGPAFSALALLPALSYEVSGRLADRIRLIHTMVFAHRPSHLLLLVA